MPQLKDKLIANTDNWKLIVAEYRINYKEGSLEVKSFDEFEIINITKESILLEFRRNLQSIPSGVLECKIKYQNRFHLKKEYVGIIDLEKEDIDKEIQSDNYELLINICSQSSLLIAQLTEQTFKTPLVLPPSFLDKNKDKD